MAVHTDTFHIEFDANEAPGTLVTTTVELYKSYKRPNDPALRADLCDHPLYPALCEYVKHHPPKSK
jgi:hypothetical protein